MDKRYLSFLRDFGVQIFPNAKLRQGGAAEFSPPPLW